MWHEFWLIKKGKKLIHLVLETILLRTFGSLVPEMCNRTSCAQAYEFPISHCEGNREGTLFS